jgi:hypothetical protein
MEDSMDDAADSPVRINTLIIPTLNELWNNPFEDLRGDLAGNFIENLLMLVMGGLIREVNVHLRNGPWTAWSG